MNKNFSKLLNKNKDINSNLKVNTNEKSLPLILTGLIISLGSIFSPLYNK